MPPSSFQLPVWQSSSTVLRRSTPEEDFLWTLQGVQSLIDQQNKILSEFKCHLATQELVSRSEEEMEFLSIPRPRFVRRGEERRRQDDKRRREEVERRREEVEWRRQEVDSLRQFQKKMEQKICSNEKVCFEVCEL